MTFPEEEEELARFPETVRRHLVETVLPLCGWNRKDEGPEEIPDLSGKRFAFFRRNLRRGGSTRVMIEQLAALEPTGASSHVYVFEAGWDSDVEAEIRNRCPNVRTIRRVSRRLASWRTLWLEAVLQRHHGYITTDIQDPMIFAATVRKFHVLHPPPIAAILHEEYDRYLEFLRPHASRISSFCMDYDFSQRLRDVFGTRISSGIVAPLFPLSRVSLQGGKELRQKLGIPSEASVMVYAGRLDRNKRIELLLGVLEDILASGHEDVWLLLAGRWQTETYRQEMDAMLQREVKGLRLADRIRDVGVVSDWGPVYDASQVYVFASGVEGFYPLAVMEAQQAGLPLVCTGAGGLRQVILDGVTGFLVPTDPCSSGAMLREDTRSVFAKRVSELLADPERRKTMGAAGAQVVQFLTARYPFARKFRQWISESSEQWGGR